LLTALFLCTPARASDEPVPPDAPDDADSLDDFAPPPPSEDVLPEALATRDREIPNTSFEFALQYGYGAVPFLTLQAPPGVGFGLRGSWGKHLGVHRLGFAITETIEGQIGTASLFATEAVASWDVIGPGGLLLGAGAGGTLAALQIHAGDNSVRVAPTVTARVGGSQTWSQHQRRLFLFVEGKLRVADGELVPAVALAVGAGKGAGRYRAN
jgi:hypothetical protein